eukprot:m.95674 g.95674  ORF g.95674 m.95674 type:complete len:1050 (+) comp26839_c1_seq1:239-3388(+)
MMSSLSQTNVNNDRDGRETVTATSQKADSSTLWANVGLRVAQTKLDTVKTKQSRVLVLAFGIFLFCAVIWIVCGLAKVTAIDRPPLSLVAEILFITVGDLDFDKMMTRRPNLELLITSTTVVLPFAIYFLVFQRFTWDAALIYGFGVFPMVLASVWSVFQVLWARFVLEPTATTGPPLGQVVSVYTGRLGISTGASMLFMLGMWLFTVVYLRLWLEADGDDIEKYPTTFPSTIYLHLTCVFATIALAQMLTIARGMVARQPTSIVMVQVMTMSGFAMGVATLVAGVEKTIIPHTQAHGMTSANYDLVMGAILTISYPVAYFNRRVLFGTISSFFDHGAKTTAAKALGQFFIPNMRGEDYVSSRNNFRYAYAPVILNTDTVPQTTPVTHAQIDRSLCASSDLVCPLTPSSTLYPHIQLGPPANAIYEDTDTLLINANATQADRWWETSTHTRFGATDYFVVAANSTNVRSAISTFVDKCGSRTKAAPPTFWIYQCAIASSSMQHTTMDEVLLRLPVAAASCKKCLVLLDEYLIQEPLGLLMLLCGLMVHTDVILHVCGSNLNLFSKSIDSDFSNWDLNAILEKHTQPLRNRSPTFVTDTSSTAIQGRTLHAVVSTMDDACELRCAVLQLREFVTCTRQKIRGASEKFNFEEVLDVLCEQNLVDVATQGVLRNVRMPRELGRDSITLLETIGQGNFGEVRKAMFDPNDGTPVVEVAVKIPKQGSPSSVHGDMMAEAIISAQLIHDNVVALIGVVTVKHPVLLVMQLCARGSFKEELLRINRARIFQDTTTKEEFIFDTCTKLKHVANGMQYLSSHKFVHRDLACRNVLIDAEKVPKISDFGMSRVMDEQSDYYTMATDQLLPVRSIAVEIFTLESAKFTEMSDCWSYAILCVEAFQLGDDPYSEIETADVVDLVISGYVHPRPPLCPVWVYDNVITMSLVPNPALRPGFRKINTALRAGMRQTYPSDYDTSSTLSSMSSVAVNHGYPRTASSSLTDWDNVYPIATSLSLNDVDAAELGHPSASDGVYSPFGVTNTVGDVAISTNYSYPPRL